MPFFSWVLKLMFEEVVAWFSNFQNDLGLVLILGSIGLLLLTMYWVGKNFG
jgi:hypothetical protein